MGYNHKEKGNTVMVETGPSYGVHSPDPKFYMEVPEDDTELLDDGRRVMGRDVESSYTSELLGTDPKTKVKYYLERYYNYEGDYIRCNLVYIRGLEGHFHSISPAKPEDEVGAAYEMLIKLGVTLEEDKMPLEP